MIIRQLIALFLLSLFVGVSPSGAYWTPEEYWPQFRGPQSSGVTEDPRLPDKWSATENIAWKTAIPGIGWSSPIVWGDQIFVTSVISADAVEPPKKGLSQLRVNPVG